MTGTLAVGIDGATWRVIDPLLESGSMPNLASVIDTGSRGDLESTMPPVTPTAWTSIATGVGPEAHGIYGFRDLNPETYTVETTGYDEVSRPALWDLFEAHDHAVGVVNYPFVRPPPQVDGFFVSGFPGSDDDPVAHPDSVEAQLEARNYRVHPRRRPTDDLEAYYREAKDLAKVRCETTIDLYGQFDVELLMPVFGVVDPVQHYLWHTDIEGRPAVERMYEYVDELIGRLRDAVGRDWNVVVFSDHGFRPIDGEVHMNSILEKGGYMRRRQVEQTRVEKISDAVLGSFWSIGNSFPFGIKERVKRAVPGTLLDTLRQSAGVGSTGMEDLAWEETDAFATGWMGRIYLHEAGLFPDGYVSESEKASVREDIQESLRELAHPETGEPVFNKVETGHEIYGPDAAGNPPAVLGTPSEWRYSVHGDFGQQWFGDPGDRVADHHPTGVIVITADGANDGGLDAAVTAIPALLSGLHGLPVFDDADHDLLSQIGFDSEVSSVAPETIEKTGGSDDGASREGVEERLRNLGYR